MIKRRTYGVIKKPEIISKELDDIVKQINKVSNEQSIKLGKSDESTGGRITALEAKTEVFTGIQLPINKIGKDGDVFIHLITKVIHIKYGGVWS